MYLTRERKRVLDAATGIFSSDARSCLFPGTIFDIVIDLVNVSVLLVVPTSGALHNKLLFFT